MRFKILRGVALEKTLSQTIASGFMLFLGLIGICYLRMFRSHKKSFSKDLTYEGFKKTEASPKEKR